jgi:hypothetical protein
MQERRHLDRKYLAVYSRIFDRKSGQVLGYLSDLSQKGAMIISDDPLPEKAAYSLRFDLPDPPLFATDHLNMEAVVAWCSPDIDPSFYNIGFEFVSVSETESKIIEDMIVAYEFRRLPPTYNTPDVPL